MERLWEDGTSTPREVLQGLNETAERTLAYTTVTTILVRLHEKGFVERQAAGRQYAYTAKVGRDDIQTTAGRRELEKLLDRYGADAVARFAEDLLPEDQKLRERLAALAATDGMETR